MYQTHKSATCCYCGTRAVLSLGGTARHELKCSACGAPLSRMKALREDHTIDRFTLDHKAHRKPGHAATKAAMKAKGRKKKRKGGASRLFDIAEEIFDIFD